MLILCASCGGGGGGANFGSVTVSGIPSDYWLGNVWVYPGAEGEWTSNPGAPEIMIPGEEFQTTVIGYGQRGEGNNESDLTLKISGAKWNADREGVDTTSFDFTYAGPASVWAVFHKPSDQYAAMSRAYNNVHFSGGRAVIGFTSFVTGFTLPQTEGKFTLTNIPDDHNGKYAILIGGYGTGNTATALYGLDDATSATAFKGFPVSGGTVTIPLFKYKTGERNFSSFEESPTGVPLVIIIQENDDFDFLEYSEGLLASPPVIPPSLTFSSVDFEDGTASKKFTEGMRQGGL